MPRLANWRRWPLQYADWPRSLATVKWGCASLPVQSDSWRWSRLVGVGSVRTRSRCFGAIFELGHKHSLKVEGVDWQQMRPFGCRCPNLRLIEREERVTVVHRQRNIAGIVDGKCIAYSNFEGMI